MEENETKDPEQGTEETKDNSGDGDKPKSTSLIDKANETLKGMEAANKKTEELVERQEALAADKMLGGESEAGGENKPEVKKETDEEYAGRVETGDANPLKDDGFI